MLLNLVLPQAGQLMMHLMYFYSESQQCLRPHHWEIRKERKKHQPAGFETSRLWGVCSTDILDILRPLLKDSTHWQGRRSVHRPWRRQGPRGKEFSDPRKTTQDLQEMGGMDWLFFLKHPGELQRLQLGWVNVLLACCSMLVSWWSITNCRIPNLPFQPAHSITIGSA